MGIAFEGFWKQFLVTESRNTLLGGGVATLAIDSYDDDIFENLDGDSFWGSDGISLIGDEMALALALAPLVTYGFAHHLENEKLRDYSVETFSAMLLAWTETAVISQFGFHERPRDQAGDEADNFFDTAFRGRSSFPSGHIIAATVLTLKTYDYYGWKPALVPAAIAGITAVNRVADGSHFPSDIASGMTLAIAAHYVTKRIYRGENDGVLISFVPLGGDGMMVTGRLTF